MERDKVSDALNEEQKRQYIKSLLKEMRKEGTIMTVGRTRGATWVLVPPDQGGGMIGDRIGEMISNIDPCIEQ